MTSSTEDMMTAFAANKDSSYEVPPMDADEARELMVSFADGFSYYYGISIEEAVALMEKAGIVGYIRYAGPYMGREGYPQYVKEISKEIERKGIDLPEKRCPL